MGYTCVNDLISGIKKRDWIALSKAITIVENDYEGKKELLDFAYKNSRESCLVFGITGSGGAGKSTVIDCLMTHYKRQGKSVGVMAVDPSSGYTGGAVLGDRVRMGSQIMSEDLFIRSFASRGSLGGISQGAKDVLYLYKAFVFDIIILESYGVGQAETDISNFADVTAVVMVPGYGDHIQMAKAGTQEIADVFVVNKADHPQADFLYSSLLSTFSKVPEERRPDIVKTIAKDHRGTVELAELLIKKAQRLLSNRQKKRRLRILNEISTNAYQVFLPFFMKEAEKILTDVLNGDITPYEAANNLGARIILKETDTV